MKEAQLKTEVEHIFESGANETRVIELCKTIIKDVSENAFIGGFDEGYTSPLERDGTAITIAEYEAHRKECFDVWISLEEYPKP